MIHKLVCMKDLSLFSPLNKEEKLKISELAIKKVYKQGEVLFHEGDPNDKIILVKSGKIKLYKLSAQGKELILDILQPDDVIGESSIFEDQVHTFCAKALEQSFVCACARNDFKKLILDHPLIAMKIIQGLVERLSSFTEQVATFAFEDVQGRIVKTLYKLGQNYGVATEKGLKVNLHLTHQDIASLVNASRVMVTNTLNKMKQEGLVDIENKFFYLSPYLTDNLNGD